jgi:N-acetylgalactosamine kinase
MINNENAQREYYLTDVVRHLSQMRDPEDEHGYRVRAIPVDNPEWIQGFNSPDELLAIQDFARREKLRQRGAASQGPQLRSNQYQTVTRWLETLTARSPAMNRWLQRIYGDHADLHEEKIRELTRVLQCYGNRFGFESKVCIVRAPGRVNLMGRHIDHRGGMTNFLAIDRETIAVAGLSDDHQVAAINTEPERYPPVAFSIPELIGRFAWSDWRDYVDSNWVRNMLYAAPGDWGHYVKAAMLRLQHRFEDVKVRGLNLALSGNVPIAAGLSSSSTVVVATLQAAIALNEFELTTQQFIDLCGEGEWFVGSRGGAGDHAAIYLGQRGRIAQVSYLPFKVERFIDAPAGYQVVIANSHVKAAKSSEAKHVFNARVADYNLGQALLAQRCPEIAEAVEYLRDVNPEKLGCRTSDVYRMLLKVPARMTRDDFRSLLSAKYHELIETCFTTHAEPEYYRPRGVLLYGIAEIMRSKMCVDLLEAGRVDRLGKLMQVSHDGDRVSRRGPDGTYQDVDNDSSDAYLMRMIDDLASEDPERVLLAQLYMQPGGYACSTIEIDQMVDIVSTLPEVAGAQIAGAGLGGCVMVLVKEGAVSAVREALVSGYYEPAELTPAVLPCIAVEGAGLVEF